MMSNESTNVSLMVPENENCAFSLSISQAACQRIQQLTTQEKQINPSSQPYLQIRVEGGGCSGFQYSIDLVTTLCAENIYFNSQDILIGIDETSLELIDGSMIDYEQNMMSASFVIKNPNATASCGCGNSFSVM